MSSARCIAAFRTNSEVCSWTRFAARWMRSKVACSARSSMRFVLTATATPPSSFSHLCLQLPITSLYGECTYTASEGCGQRWGPPRDHTCEVGELTGDGLRRFHWSDRFESHCETTKFSLCR